MKSYTLRRAEAEEAVDELASVLREESRNEQEGAQTDRIVKGTGAVVLGIWHELHRIADAIYKTKGPVDE
jgi:uncharacterized membrane protein YqiK